MQPSSVGNLFVSSQWLSRRSSTASHYDAQRLASVAGHGADSVADNFDDGFWSRDAGRVIDRERLDVRLHARRHIALRLRDDHSIVFGHQKPTRNVLPKRASDGNGNATQRYRPLHGGKYRKILRGCVLGERRREGVVG